MGKKIKPISERKYHVGKSGGYTYTRKKLMSVLTLPDAMKKGLERVAELRFQTQQSVIMEALRQYIDKFNQEHQPK